MWKVFFGYTWTNGVYYPTYICNDWKWRGYAKLEAGWWIQFDSTEFSWPVVNWIYDYEHWKYRNSSDGFDWWTWYGFSDGIWLWIWNLVSIVKNNPRQVIFDFIDKNKSKIYIETGIKSDGVNVAKLTGEFVDNVYEKLINDLSFSYISFTGCNGNNVFCINWKSWLLFNNKKYYLSGIFVDSWYYFNTGIVSILPYSWSFSLYFSWSGKWIILSGSTYFVPPFDVEFNLYDWDWDWKLLIWDVETGSVNFSIPSNVKNLDLVWLGKYLGTWQYNFVYWNVFYTGWEFSFKIYPKSEYIDNSLLVYYKLNWKYDFVYNWYLYTGITFETNTNKVKIYPDKKLHKVVTVWNCFSVPSDGKSVCNLKLYLKNWKWYNIPLLKIWNFIVDDGYKNVSGINKYQTFDLDELTSWYETWLFLSWYTNLTNNEGYINIQLISYKPVYNAKLIYKFYDLTWVWDPYNWYQSFFSWYKKWIFWWKAVDIFFSWDKVSEGILLNSDNQVELVYTWLVSNVEASGYYLSWEIVGSSDCVFLSWWQITWSNFWSKSVNIYISWNIEPDYITYYEKYYSYYVESWIDWSKFVKLKPNIKINWKNLIVAWQFFGLKLLGLLNRGVISNVNKLKTIAVIWSKIPFSSYIYDIKRKIYSLTRWWEIYTYSDWDLYNVIELENYKKFFDCNWKIVELWDWTNDIIIKWNNIIVLKDCPLVIKSNIIKNSDHDKLKIISFSSKWSFINFSKNDGWKLLSNIYIASNVSTIMADLITDGSIFTLSWSQVSSWWVFVYKRRSQPVFKRQLYIKWKIISRNTMWGGFIDAFNKVTFPWWRKFDAWIKGIFNYDVTADILAQAYDINFWRANLVDWWSSTYDTGLVSEVIKNKYGCKWNVNEDPVYCWMPIVVEYDR